MGSLVQHPVPSVDDLTTGTTSSKAYGSNVTAGNVLLAFAGTDTATTLSVSDNVEGAWTPLGSLVSGAGGLASWRFQAFVKVAGSSGARTVTVTSGASSTRRTLDIFEYSGVGAVESVASQNSNSGAGTSFTAPAATPGSSSDIVVVGAIAQQRPSAVSSPFTYRGDGSTVHVASADFLTPTASTSYTAVFTVAAGGWDSSLITVVLTPANAPISTFTENFTGTLAQWTNEDANGGSSSIVSGRLQQVSGGSTTLLPQARLYTSTPYDLTGGSVFAQLVTPPGSTVISAFRLMLDDNNWIGIRYDNLNLVAYKSEASVSADVGSASYNASTMKYLRIRNSGSNNVVLEYSADASSWTTLGTTTVSFGITGVRPWFATYSVTSQASQSAIWDNVNSTGTLQFARPSADAAIGGWTPTPGSPTTLFDKIDEVTVDDTDYISAVAS